MTPRGKITLVLCCLGLCAVAVWWRAEAGEREARLKPSDLFGVVEQQFAACREEDYPAAYRQASATIQERFPLERFAAMTRNDYSRVIKSGRVEFGAWQTQGRRAVVEVFFISRDGTVLPCLYTLVYEGEAWKIDGMRWTRPVPNGKPLRGLRS